MCSAVGAVLRDRRLPVSLGLRAVILASVALLMAAPAAFADAAGSHYAYCFTNLPDTTGYQPGQPTYFSATFRAANENYRGLFPLYVTKKYGWKSVGMEVCSYGASEAGVEQSRRDRVAQVKAAGHEVVETGWMFTPNSSAEIQAMPAAPAPAAAAPAKPAATPKASPQQDAYERALAAQRPASVGHDAAAPAAHTKNAASAGAAAIDANRPAPNALHFFCWGQRFPAYGSPEASMPPTVYLTPAFDAPSGNIGSVSSEFKQHLRQKYNLNASTSVSCATYPTLAAAEAARQKRQAEVKNAKQTEVLEAWPQ